MDTKQLKMYAACDKAIKELNRIFLEAFGRLKGRKFDRNLVKTILELYRKLAKLARKRYYEIGFEAYLLAMAVCDIEPKKAARMAEKAITAEWVDMILSQTDLVTLYRFDTETERKAYRLAEALEATDDRDYEVNKALRFWSQQVGQYAINFTDYAETKAFEDAGVEMAEWVAVRDGRQCNECMALDGQVFSIKEFPAKPHFGCRCRKRPVFRD